MCIRDSCVLKAIFKFLCVKYLAFIISQRIINTGNSYNRCKRLKTLTEKMSQAVIEFLEKDENSRPVSYTHLDVYKRQQCGRYNDYTHKTIFSVQFLQTKFQFV